MALGISIITQATTTMFSEDEFSPTLPVSTADVVIQPTARRRMLDLLHLTRRRVFF